MSKKNQRSRVIRLDGTDEIPTKEDFDLTTQMGRVNYISVEVSKAIHSIRETNQDLPGVEFAHGVVLSVVGTAVASGNTLETIVSMAESAYRLATSVMGDPRDHRPSPPPPSAASRKAAVTVPLTKEENKAPSTIYSSDTAPDVVGEEHVRLETSSGRINHAQVKMSHMLHGLLEDSRFTVGEIMLAMLGVVACTGFMNQVPAGMLCDQLRDIYRNVMDSEIHEGAAAATGAPTKNVPTAG